MLDPLSLQNQDLIAAIASWRPSCQAVGAPAEEKEGRLQPMQARQCPGQDVSLQSTAPVIAMAKRNEPDAFTTLMRAQRELSRTLNFFLELRGDQWHAHMWQSGPGLTEVGTAAQCTIACAEQEAVIACQHRCQGNATGVCTAGANSQPVTSHKAAVPGTIEGSLSRIAPMHGEPGKNPVANESQASRDCLIGPCKNALSKRSTNEALPSQVLGPSTLGTSPASAAEWTATTMISSATLGLGQAHSKVRGLNSLSGLNTTALCNTTYCLPSPFDCKHNLNNNMPPCRALCSGRCYKACSKPLHFCLACSLQVAVRLMSNTLPGPSKSGLPMDAAAAGRHICSSVSLLKSALQKNIRLGRRDEALRWR